MIDLDLIKSSPSRQMELSELLFEKSGMGCWHKGKSTYENGENIFEQRCIGGCNQIFRNHTYVPVNPNLFLDGNSFFIVWKAVKDREDWQTFVEHIEDNYFNEYDSATMNIMSLFDLVDSPFFQYELLKWLLEKDGELGRLEEIMEKGEDNK